MSQTSFHFRWIKKLFIRSIQIYCAVSLPLSSLSLFIYFYFYLFLFKVAPMAYASSWPRGQIGTAAAVYTTTRTTTDPSCICHLCCSLQQHQIFNPWARPGIEPSSSRTLWRVLNWLSRNGNASLFLIHWHLLQMKVLLQCPLAAGRVWVLWNQVELGLPKILLIPVFYWGNLHFPVFSGNGA